MLEEELTTCFETHRPKMFIFDGAYPYRGMLRTISMTGPLSKIWMRRGTFRKGASIPVDSIQHFDLIIRPEDSVPSKSDSAHAVEVVNCSPIVLLNQDEQLSRDLARKKAEYTNRIYCSLCSLVQERSMK